MVNKDFRLWLTSQPTSAFPVTILQNSVKISVENPNNLKANLLRVWQNNISEEQLNDSIKVDANKLKYKKLVYSLSLFYAVLLQRKKYGSIGFNTPYAWSASDIQICIQQLPTFLDKYLDTYPKQALLYLFAEINIGGCVTDAIDQRTVNAIVEDYLNIDVIKDNYMFQSGRVRTDADANSPEFYQLPGDLSYDAYLEQINELIPQECHPINIGLNMNSNITADRGECQKLLDGLMDMYTGKLQETDKSSEKSDKENSQEERQKESGDLQLVLDLQSKIPKQFDIEAITLKYPTIFEESLNSLLAQECGRFNILLQKMSETAVELIKALQGKTIMSEELEKVLQALQMNKIPEEFAKYSYPSLKPFNSYLADLEQRVKFFDNWVKHGKPQVYNISVFFFAQGFLTSVLQNYARKYSVAIDTISFRFGLTTGVMDDEKYIESENTLSPQIVRQLMPTPASFDNAGDNTFITGLYMEAARLNEQTLRIEEAAPRELYYKMPVLRFTPVV